MNKFTVLMAAWTLALACLGMGQVEAQTVQTLRGDTPLAGNDSSAPDPKRWQADRPPIPRNYVQQPPLVPHSTEEYVIDTRQNKCLTCHSWSTYRQSHATKISLTHFRDRGGTETSDIAPQRYFCTQCHVPQMDAEPLVGNSFQPVNALSPR